MLRFDGGVSCTNACINSSCKHPPPKSEDDAKNVIPGLGNCFVSNVDQLYVQGSMGGLYIYIYLCVPT